MSCLCETGAKSLSGNHIDDGTLRELFDRTFHIRLAKCDSAWRPSTIAILSEIDRVDEDITYNEFFVKYIFGNQPCIIGEWITKDWRAISDWVVTDSMSGKSQIHFSKLESLFGDATVPVADCSNRYYNSQCKVEMLFSEYISYLRRHRQCSEMDNSTDQCLYLKDWHFHKQFPEYQAYKTPKYFTSDWLNYKCDLNSCDDYRFVYMGPKGSWTPFHADVYRSYSWSANVCGRKRWLLFPPGEETKMKDKLGNLPYDVFNSISSRPDIKCIDIVQEEGEIIFVPSGWHHQVHNIEDAISINHNWLNGANIRSVAQFLLSQAALVRTEIYDCKALMTSKEWNDQCEVILRADSGMNVHDFIKFLDVIARNRSAFLYSKYSIFSQFSINDCHDSFLMFSNLIDITKAAIELFPLPKGGTATACPHDAMNGSLDVVNHENVSLCFNHALFDLYMLLDAAESIHGICKEIDDADLLLQLAKIYDVVLKFFNDFVLKVEGLGLQTATVTNP